MWISTYPGHAAIWQTPLSRSPVINSILNHSHFAEAITIKILIITFWRKFVSHICSRNWVFKKEEPSLLSIVMKKKRKKFIPKKFKHRDPSCSRWERVQVSRLNRFKSGPSHSTAVQLWVSFNTETVSLHEKNLIYL